jgi:hypothetical protein
MTFPVNDTDFYETSVGSVEALEDGWTIELDSGSLCVPKGPVEPREGMTARLYGKGLGYRVRGLFLDGQEVWYRTAEEDKQHSADELYGKDATDILSRWDEGRSVWSVEMGGLGPGYEQAIQVMVFEMLRALLDMDPDEGEFEEEKWPELRDRIDEQISKTIDEIGPSGAQWGAALNLALGIYRRGPQAIHNEVPNDRHIQVSRVFP